MHDPPRHRLGLPQGLVIAEIDPARIGDHRHRHPALVRRVPRQSLEEFDAGIAERLGICHHVRLRDRHEVSRIEHRADLQHMIHRPALRLPHCASQHRLLFFAEPHCVA